MRTNRSTRIACASALVAALVAGLLAAVPAPVRADEPAAGGQAQEAVVVEDVPAVEGEDPQAGPVEEPQEPALEAGAEEAVAADAGEQAEEAELETMAGPSVTYRVHAQTYGWLNWQTDGALAGTTGQAKRVEAIEIKVNNNGVAGGIRYRVHVQSYGWTDWKADGALAGTYGEAKRVEAIQIKLTGALASQYDVWYRVHTQGYGWLGWTKNGEYAGTQALAKRVEAIEIRLVKKGGAAPGSTTRPFVLGGMVSYRTHCQTYGWLGWAKNGASAGSEGLSKRVEAFEIRLVKKGGAAPGSTDNAFVKAGNHNIMGTSQTTVDQMVRCFNATGYSYPSAALGKGGAPTIRDFCQILYEEAQAEGVRAEVVFAQAMLETAWLRYGGDVKISQFNFAGLGATGNGEPGNSFSSVRMGLRAQVQHLKAYASTAPLNNTCVDVRFGYVQRGCAPTVEQLSQRWATGADYGNNIISVMNNLLKA